MILLFDIILNQDLEHFYIFLIKNDINYIN